MNTEISDLSTFHVQSLHHGQADWLVRMKYLPEQNQKLRFQEISADASMPKYDITS